MATKKAKRAAVAARTEAFLAEVAADGQKAIEKAAQERHEANLKTWERGHEKHYTFVDECPHCTIIKEERTKQEAARAVAKVASATLKRQFREERIEQTEARLSRAPKAEIEGVDVFHPFAAKVDA